jgi:hypothetical protein
MFDLSVCLPLRGVLRDWDLYSNPGNHDRGETPVPIPNTEAKPSGADGTARGAWWESRKLPGFYFFCHNKGLNQDS